MTLRVLYMAENNVNFVITMLQLHIYVINSEWFNQKIDFEDTCSTQENINAHEVTVANPHAECNHSRGLEELCNLF